MLPDAVPITIFVAAELLTLASVAGLIVWFYRRQRAQAKVAARLDETLFIKERLKAVLSGTQDLYWDASLNDQRVWISKRLDVNPDARFEKRLYVYPVQNTCPHPRQTMPTRNTAGSISNWRRCVR